MTLTERMARVETQVIGLKTSIEEIKNNHLEHMRVDISDMKDDIQEIKVNQAKLAVKVGFIAAGASVIIQVLAQLILDKV